MNWKRVRLLIWKEFVQLRRDPAMLRILFIMPIIQLVLFGYVVGSDIKNLTMAVNDQDHSIQSQRVIDSFTSANSFRLTARPTTEADLKLALDSGAAVIGVTIPKGLSEAVADHRSSQLGIVIDGSDSRTSQLAAAYASGIIADLSSKLYPTQGAKTSGPQASMGVSSQVRVLYNPTMRAVNTMVPALLALILLMSTTNIMSAAIVKERERGTLEQLFVTPISRTEYLLGKLLPYTIVAFIQVFVTFVVGVIWFQVPFHGSLWVIGAGLMLFMLAALGIGMLISLMSKTRQQAQQVSMFMQMPNMMLSGFMFPVEAFPTWLYYLTFAVPLRYILVILRSNFVKGSPFSALWFQFVAIAIFSIAIFVFALTRFQKRLAD